MDELASFIETLGYKFTPTELDGRWHEVTCETTDKKLSYIGEKDADDKISLTFKCWQDGAQHSYLDKDKKKLTKDEKKARELERLDRWELISKIAAVKYKETIPDGTRYDADNYLENKGFAPNISLTLPRDYGAWGLDGYGKPRLMVPMSDVNGKMWNIQFIQNNGFKSNIAKGRTQGLFCKIGAVETPELYICEGYATALAVHLATHKQSLCAFGLNNIKFVLEEIKKAKWKRAVIVVLDNDHEKKVNAGATEMAKLKKKFGGLTFITPQNVSSGETDYNDVMKSRGLSGVAEDIDKQLSLNSKPNDETNKGDTPPVDNEETKGPQAEHVTKTKWYLERYINGVAPMPVRYNENDKEIMPTESEVAMHVMKYYDGRVCAWEGACFIYKDTHWVEMGFAEEATLMQQITIAYNGKAGHSKYKAAKNIFLDFVPVAEMNMFQANPYLINLKNGTIHIVKKDGKWDLDFRPHNKLDFCTNVIPLEYDKTRKIKNVEFESMVLRLLGDNPDKVRSLKQMYGACLSPIFPRLFMLVGRRGSGKSSLILGAIKLVHERNVGRVQLCEMKHPFLENLIGKLVNVVTDIDISRPIEDAIVKQIEDRIPLSINRKFKAVINAPIPAVHIFGGNEIPPTLERGSGAHTRRWTFLKVEKFNAENDGYSRDFANDVFDLCPQGVLNFALEGLCDLLGSDGLYFASEESKTIVKDWQSQNDVISCFIDDVKNGEVLEVAWTSGAWCRRSDLWKYFVAWHQLYYNRASRIPKGKFFSALEKFGADFRKYAGNHQISNFEVKSGEDIAQERRDQEKTKNEEKTQNKGRNSAPNEQEVRRDTPY